MSYFNRFPEITYDFLNNGRKSTIPNIFRQIKIVNKRFDSIAVYEKYTIQEERPDQLSYKLYGTTDFYWTFFVVNESLRNVMNGWPLSSLALEESIIEKYPNHTITPYRDNLLDPKAYNSIAGKFPIGTTITGSVSGATGTILKRNTAMNQLVFAYTTGSPAFVSNDQIVGEDTSGVFYYINDKFDVREEKNSPQRYVDSTGEAFSNYLNIQQSGSIITYTDYENELNDEKREIRVIRKEYIEDFATNFRRLIND